MKRIVLLIASIQFFHSVSIAQNNQWVWMKGDRIGNVNGIYGTVNIPAAGNKPGSRQYPAKWRVGNNLWVFGGYGNGESGTGDLNDLWQFNISTNSWTWIKGDKIPDQFGIYGTINVPAVANKPGGRDGSVSWTDGAGNLWLFGGNGYGETAGSGGLMNDLWKFNTSTGNWTWEKGDKTGENAGIYGTLGVAAASNKPGGRANAVTWTDGSGNLWLFGGVGYGEGSYGYLNDLWKFNTATGNWTWVSGDKTGNITGVYGTIGVASATNKPGGRSNLMNWVDANGNFWLFGGYGYSESSQGVLNDLWMYNISTNQWTWVNGDKTPNELSEYGLIGVPSILNKVGARSDFYSWTDNNNNLWLYGGTGYDVNGIYGYLSDLWRYNISANQWVWVKGSNLEGQYGYYGGMGSSSPDNKPGARTNGVSWTDLDGYLWMFGGVGNADGYPTPSGGYLNDLWRFWPCSNNIQLNSSANGFCDGVNSILLTASGGGATYEWYKDGTILSGQTSSTFTAILAGKYYVTSTVGACTLYSAEITLSSAAIPPSLGGTGVYCIGDPVNVGIPQTEIDQDYTWRQNGVAVYGPIGGNGGNQSLNFNMIAGKEGTYIVRSSKPGCSEVFSNTVYVGLAEINNLATLYICGDGVTFNWKRCAPISIPENYQYAITTDPNPPNEGTNTYDSIASVNSLAPSTQYYIHVRPACFSGGFGDWVSISFTTAGTTGGVCEWVGGTSTVWSNPQNWKCGIVPGPTSEVEINGGRAFYPNITSNTTIKKITINNGASINVATGVQLTITSQ